MSDVGQLEMLPLLSLVESEMAPWIKIIAEA